MNYKILSAVIIFVLVLGATYFIRMNQDGYSGSNTDLSSNPNVLSNSQEQAIDSEDETEIEDESDDETEGSADAQNQDQAPASGKISAEILSAHNSLQDCWVSYNGKVYDITSFLPKHPGTAGKILPYCGTAEEFQNAFTKKHGTSKVSMLMQVGVFIGDFDVMGDLG